MLEYVQCWHDEFSNSEEEMLGEANAMTLSAAAIGDPTVPAVSTMKLRVQLQGRTLYFLVDSGSSHTFLDTVVAASMSGVLEMPVSMVRVAYGKLIPCSSQLKTGQWSCGGYNFTSLFKVFPLGTYDGILGMDWLAAHSPMQVDWAEHWISFQKDHVLITLLGADASPQLCAVMEMSALLVTEEVVLSELPQEVQELIEKFALVFAAPSGLPPRRKYDHTIPLIPGAGPVAIRPYRVAPSLKDELERQAQEMLDSGVIRPSNSPFSSPMLLQEIGYLGHIISGQGVSTDPAKISAIQDWPVPVSVKEAALASAHVLAHPDFSKMFVVETDACDVGIGAVLMQDGHPLAYPLWLEEIIQSYVDDPFSAALLQRLALHPQSDKKFSLRVGILRIDQCFPQAKPNRIPYPGLLQPLPIPNLPWEMVTIDFVEGLPTSGRYNCLFVVIDKLTKYGHFISLHHPFTLVSVAEAFLNSVYRLHGMPLSIVSDRDRVFTSLFWKELFAKTGVLLRTSSARHPQTDGQAEGVNQQVECFLRCFVGAHPARWAQWIPLCEFWHNTNWHSATGQTPFEVVYGHAPHHFGISVDDTIQSEDLKQWLDQRKVILDSVQQHLFRAQQRMKVQITARVGEVAYELALPASSKVHPVFHVSLLKKVLAPGCKAFSQLPPSDAHLQETKLQEITLFKAISFLLPHLRNIHSIPSIGASAAADRRTMRDRGKPFANKLAYKAVWKQRPRDQLALAIWRNYAPNKCRIFVWLAQKDHLFTNERRFRRGIATADTCPFCTRCESITHLLFQCHQLAPIWDELNSLCQGAPQGLLHALEGELNNKCRSTVLMAVLWNIWKRRNAKVFRNEHQGLHLVARSAGEDLRLWSPVPTLPIRFCLEIGAPCCFT
ncbi:uncharacterized protein [Aegilops tauschii subsp. strangulata]|uniref:uncharacterized protein n=1 Tax=Aegilops tauschii subsp. strangulata TaxID=200361 RepID=UPI003CC853AF